MTTLRAVTIARVLVVDDDAFFRALFHDVVAQAGFAVQTATGPIAAAPLLAGVDVLVTDVIMPEGDGIELVRTARALRPDLEAVVVSQRDEVRAAVAAMKAGAAEYLVKPVDAEELVLCVKRCAERVALKRERARLLDENLAFVRQQLLWQRCLGLLATLDAEGLHEETLDALLDAGRAAGAALWLPDEAGALTLRATRGAIERTTLPARLDPAAPTARSLLQPGGIDQPEPGRVRFSLHAAGELQGVAMIAAAQGEALPADDVAVGRAIGDFAAMALRNTRRFAALERGGLRDRETGAYNLAYFVDHATKESYKARRYGRTFSLVLLTLDGLAELRRREGREAAAMIARATLAAVARIGRDADVIARVSDDEFYVLLPETDPWGASIFRRRVHASCGADRRLRELDPDRAVEVVLGGASFPGDGDDFDELLLQARRRAQEERTSLVRSLGLAGLGFWECVGRLLDPGTPLPAEAGPGASRRGSFPASLFDDLQREAARELSRDAGARGAVFVVPGARPLSAALPVVEALSERDVGGRVTLLGRRGAEAIEHAAATPVYLEADDAVARNEVLLFQNEHAAYAFLRRAQSSAAPAFHSSDTPLVELLVARLQERYELT